MEPRDQNSLSLEAERMNLFERKHYLLFACLVSIGYGCGSREMMFRDEPPIFHLHRIRLKKAPARRNPGWRALYLRRVFVEPGQEFLEIELKKEAVNVNSVGLTPDSPFFKNSSNLKAAKSFYTSQFTGESLQRVRGSPAPKGLGLEEKMSPGPSLLGKWSVFAAGRGEGGPWVAVKDARGRFYLLQFDHPRWPGLATSSTLVANRLLQSLGYSVFERSMVFFTEKMLRIDSRATFSSQAEPLDAIWSSKTLQTLQILEAAQTPQTLQTLQPSKGTPTKLKVKAVLGSLHREEDGSIRALATNLLSPLSNKYLGPFPLRGRRTDDGNDHFEHQHLRELRGLKLISALLGLYNIEERSGADFFSRNNRVVSHYLWDFKGALGADKTGRPKSVEAAFGRGVPKKDDLGGVLKERENDTKKFPEVGFLPVRRFEPKKWRPRIRHPAFHRATRRDLFWAGRVLSSIGSKDIKDAVAMAYLPKRTARMLWARLWLRLRRAVFFGLSQSAPMGFFETAGSSFCAVDFRVEAGFEEDEKSEPKYEVALRKKDGKKLTRLTVTPGFKGKAQESSGRFCFVLSLDNNRGLPDYLIVDLRRDDVPNRSVAVHLTRNKSRSKPSTARPADFRVVGVVR